MGGGSPILKFLGGDRLAVIWNKERTRILNASCVGLAGVFVCAIFYLCQAGLIGRPQAYHYLEVGGILVSFCFAASSLVRFRGTQDRTSLILAFAFVLSGIIETVGYFGLNDRLLAGHVALNSLPMGWMVSRTLLAILLLSAIAVERYIPTARRPGRETAGALLAVAIAAYLTIAAFLSAPVAPVAHPANFVPRPWDLLPAALFFAAAVFFHRRLKTAKINNSIASTYDYALFTVAVLNVICHLAAAFSRQFFDGPFFLAELSKLASYCVMLGGALLDQARMFEQVRSMAVSDPLTGLANYRCLISVLKAELDRSRRTQRAFGVVLLDVDGLKAINDKFGHLTGSRALVRLGKILRSHSRAIDTAARYGGDEFAVVLPESGPEAAARVVARIRERLSAEAESPALSVSAGVAAYPEDGDSPEKLLGAADRDLYGTKNRGNSVQDLAHVAACL